MPVTPRQSKSTTKTTVSNPDLLKHQQELGMFGRVLGSQENAPVYIAGSFGFLALIGAVLIGAFGTITPERSDLVKALAGIVIASLSFLGGYAGRPRSDRN